MTKDLWLIFTSLLLFSVGFGLYFFSWPLFVQSLGASAVELGYLSALAAFLAALSVIPGGYLADRCERRWQLILGWAMVIPAPLFYLAAGEWHDLIPGVVLFAASVFNMPAITAYTVAKARPGRASSALSVVYASLSVGFVAGPLLAVPLTAAWGMRGVFWLAATLYTASTAVICGISPDFPAGGEAQRPVAARRLRLELPGRDLVSACLAFLLVAATLYLTNAFVAPFARDVLHKGVDWVNAAGAVTGLGGVLLSLALGRYADRAGPRPALAVGLALYALSMAGLVLAGRWPLVWLALGLRGATDAVKTLMSSTIAHETPRERLGRSLGFYHVLAGLGYTLGPVVGGYAYTRHPSWPFWLAAMAAVLLVPGVLAAHRRSEAAAALTAPPGGW